MDVRPTTTTTRDATASTTCAWLGTRPSAPASRRSPSASRVLARRISPRCSAHRATRSYAHRTISRTSSPQQSAGSAALVVTYEETMHALYLLSVLVHV